MIIFKGNKYVRTEKEFIDSLFSRTGTADGYYRINKRSITLMDHNKVKIGVIKKEK